jgi:hypothetical protein
MLARKTDSRYPNFGVTWTIDYKTELPVKIGKSGIAGIEPSTLIDEFRLSVKKYA